MVTLSPADLSGTATLSYRFRDPDRRDAVWVYVPAVRRVRQVSPTNRSDGLLGSDVSPDDGHFFDGKPEDFTWTLAGRREGLVVADPDSLLGRGGPSEWIEALGAWRDRWIDAPPAAGFETSGWRGVSWAPAGAQLAKRAFWVVEGIPRDRYYSYGRLELWIDAATWKGAWNRKFSWTGELVNTYGVSTFLNHPHERPGASEPEWFWSARRIWACGEWLT